MMSATGGTPLPRENPSHATQISNTGEAHEPSRYAHDVSIWSGS